MHFVIAELLEHAASVQAVDMAEAGMHVVGIVQASRDDGGQQPWTPRYVFVAQISFVLKQVIEDSVELLVLLLIFVSILSHLIIQRDSHKCCHFLGHSGV